MDRIIKCYNDTPLSSLLLHPLSKPAISQKSPELVARMTNGIPVWLGFFYISQCFNEVLWNCLTEIVKINKQVLMQ